MNPKNIEAFKKAIQENLPAMVAGELATYLADAELTKSQLGAARREIQHDNEVITKLEAENKELRGAVLKWEKRDADMKANEARLADFEHQLAMSELKGICIQNAKDDIFALAKIAFGGGRRVVTENISGTESVPVAQGQYVGSVPVNKTVTRTEDNT